MPDRPLRTGERIAIAAADLTDAEMDRIMASVPPGPGYNLADLYPIEDGPGSERHIELTVRVLVGTERSTVIVADPVTGRALAHEVVPHGAEAGAAAAAVASPRTGRDRRRVPR